MELFHTLIEIKILPGADFNDQSHGAFVRVHIGARSEHEAREKLSAALEERSFELVDTEWFVNEADVDWENADSADASALSKEAKQQATVVFGDFHCWSEDGE